jgi:hypothetical protein
MVDAQELEFRGRVLASLQDIQRRLDNVERGLQDMATHEWRIKSLESARQEDATTKVGIGISRVSVWVVAIVGVGQIIAMLLTHHW